MYKRYKWMRRYLRFRLAIQQLRLKPYLNVLLGIVLIGFVVFWKNKEIFYIHVPQFLLPICRGAVHFMGIVLFMFLLFFTVYMIGVFTASRDEMNIEIAFNGNDLRNGCPILIQKKMDKETGVTKREFYSNIPMQRWVKNKEEIADSMDVHFVKPDIEYGGRRKDKGKRIVLYTAKGRVQLERGILYDEE